jgi:hypothetical protein
MDRAGDGADDAFRQNCPFCRPEWLTSSKFPLPLCRRPLRSTNPECHQTYSDILHQRATLPPAVGPKSQNLIGILDVRFAWNDPPRSGFTAYWCFSLPRPNGLNVARSFGHFQVAVVNISVVHVTKHGAKARLITREAGQLRRTAGGPRERSPGPPLLAATPAAAGNSGAKCPARGHYAALHRAYCTVPDKARRIPELRRSRQNSGG